MESREFKLIKAIRSAVENQPQDAITAQVIAEGREELRKSNIQSTGQIQLPAETRATIAAQSANSGKEAVSEQKLSFIEPLRSKLVTVDAGATFLSGLVGNVSMPSYSGTNTLWKGETVAADDGAGTTDEVLLSPKRLTAFIKISKLFLLQDSISAEKMLMDDILRSVSDKLESTIFGTVAGNATQPGGLFVSAPTINGAATWAKIVSLETTVDTANALTTAKYITNAAGRALLKTTLKVANEPVYLMDPDGKVNGYETLVTNHIPSGLQVGADEHGIIFGDWSNLCIGSWGSLDLTIDPFSAASTGEVVITINAYVDYALRRAAAFKTGSIK
jgi:HK97 family phage major capsid protein